jgi:putative endonuclease
MTDQAVSAHSKGLAGEERAAAYLAREGWTVLARNWRSPPGEIDIIANRRDQLAFIEVKSWSAFPRADLEHSIDRRKRARISRAARLFLSRRPELSALHARFDVLFLEGDGGGIEHIEDAFAGEGID